MYHHTFKLYNFALLWKAFHVTPLEQEVMLYTTASKNRRYQYCCCQKIIPEKTFNICLPASSVSSTQAVKSDTILFLLIVIVHQKMLQYLVSFCFRLLYFSTFSNSIWPVTDLATTMSILYLFFCTWSLKIASVLLSGPSTKGKVWHTSGEKSY